MPDQHEEALLRLERAGLIVRVNQRYRTTNRWQGAMARAALELQNGSDVIDLRMPIAHALMSVFGVETAANDLVEWVAIMLPIEVVELEPRTTREG